MDTPCAAEFPLRVGEGANPKPKSPHKGVSHNSKSKRTHTKNKKKPKAYEASNLGRLQSKQHHGLGSVLLLL